MFKTQVEGDWFYYQAFGVLKAARFGFFLVRARTNMGPNKWVIFAYDGVPAHGDSATPLAPYVQSLYFPTPPPPPHTHTPRCHGTGNRYKSRLKALNQGRHFRPEIYGHN